RRPRRRRTLAMAVAAPAIRRAAATPPAARRACCSWPRSASCADGGRGAEAGGSSRDRAFDADPALGRAHLVVELAQEAEPDRAFDVPALRQILGVDAKVARLVPQTLEPLDADHVAMLTANGRTHHRDRLALTWVVAEFVEDLRSEDRLGR